VKYAAKPGGSAVSGTIVQKDAPQELVTVVPVYAVFAGKNVLLGQVFADGPETNFHFSAPPEHERSYSIPIRRYWLDRSSGV